MYTLTYLLVLGMLLVAGLAFLFFPELRRSTLSKVAGAFFGVFAVVALVCLRILENQKTSPPKTPPSAVPPHGFEIPPVEPSPADTIRESVNHDLQIINSINDHQLIDSVAEYELRTAEQNRNHKSS